MDPEHSPAPQALEAVQAQEDATAVCCGCRPPPRRRFRKLSKMISSRVTRSQKFYDAQQPESNSKEEPSDSDSLFYFDAEQNPLRDDEYPIVFTDFIIHPKPTVSMTAPETMLRKSVDFVEQVKSNENSYLRRQVSAPIENHKSRSARLEHMIRRSTMEQQLELEDPRVKIPLQGYPGDLTVSELAECVSTTDIYPLHPCLIQTLF